MNIKINFRSLIFPVLLLAVVIFIAFRNYVPGTYLSGWDTLHPEFNFALYFQRLFFGVFRPEQGLGAVAAQSQMSDLPRALVVALSSLIIPRDFLRYFFIMVYLLVGVLGVYFFIERALPEEKSYSQKAAFLGALFYLFNLGTLQQFVVVLEMFAVEYGMLPWLFLTTLEYLRSGQKKYLLWFALTAFLSAPMAQTATLWYVFLAAFILYLSFFFFKNKRKVLNLLAILLAVNSFWLLPNLYFLASPHAREVQDAKVNKIFSEEAFLHNQNHGNFLDLIVFKNFLFDWMIYTGPAKDTYDYLLADYRQYIAQGWVISIGYGAAAFVFLGIFITWRKKQSPMRGFILPTIFVAGFLMNNSPPFKSLFSFLQSHVPFFEEALRLPFTKFSILLMFFFACYFATSFAMLLRIAENITRKIPFFTIILTALVAVLLSIYGLPFFKGELISRYMQVKIPSEYFALFKWFDSQPDGRIAQFPVHSFWNWSYYSWGFQGAYFVPFGIKQPLLDRDYDRWNLDNERAFRELSYAVYSQNPSLLENVLNKYQITYLLLDKNILAPGISQDKKVLFFGEIESLLSDMGDKIKLEKRFDNISVYKVVKTAEAIRVAPKYADAFTPKKEVDIDWIYKDLGDYISVTSGPAFIYPFRSLSDNQNFLTSDISQLAQFFPSQGVLSAADYLSKEQYIPADVYVALQENNLVIKLIMKLAKAQPVQFTYPIPKTSPNQSWFLNLDNNQTFILRNLDKNFSYQGKVFLTIRAVNNLALYSQESEKLQNSSVVSVQPELCQSPAADQEAGLNILQDGLRVTAKNTSACISIPLTQLVNLKDLSASRNLLRMSFLAIPSDTEIKGHYCLFDKMLNRCTKEMTNVTGEVVDYLLANSSDIDRWNLVLFADNIGSLQTRSVTYKQLKVFVNKPTTIWTLTPQDLNQLFLGQTLNLEIGSALNLLGDLPVGNVHLFESGHTKTSCRDELPKKFDRIINQSKGYVEYSALDGYSCDYFALPNLPHDLGYLLSLKSQNVSGLPLRVCFANSYSKRCDVFSALPKNNQFSNDTILIPPASDGGVGYELHFTNDSIGETPTINRISEIKLTPFPYYWLTELNIKPENGKGVNYSKMQVQSFRQILPQLFIANLSNSDYAPGLLVLDQSYDSGWWASVGKHVLVNGWANGWLIAGKGSKQVIIFFWPQLLEFLGFGILAVAFFVLIRNKQRNSLPGLDNAVRPQAPVPDLGRDTR